ncbi:MAG: HTH domain-containing protein [Sphaerochaetaceae bacterium]|jgi:hypothetical protein|nr:hypothetical protein [Sphaerochaeta sp.]
MAKDGTNRGGARPGAGRPRKGDRYAHVEFTPNQVHELLESPHVAYISRKSVSFTKTFKEMVWQRYLDGIKPKDIFIDAGLRVETFGMSRINSFIKTLRNQKERGLSFTEGNEPHLEDAVVHTPFPKIPRRANNSRRPVMNEKQLADLVNLVAYMSQEIEFLKKIILAGTEGK